jgi:secretion/DNA translocation related TadE-like protein
VTAAVTSTTGRRERGAATIVVIGVFVLGMALMLGATRLGVAMLARARAETAADAAALAAADTLALGGGAAAATDQAAAVAEANGARLVGCDCSGPFATATVEVDVPVLGRIARARSRAEVTGTVLPDP